MSQRHIEAVIGRLVTDEEFRKRFLADREAVLAELDRAGLELTAAECSALAGTSPDAWGRMAEVLDPRLQKASLK
jgi:hypothetical protein